MFKSKKTKGVDCDIKGWDAFDHCLLRNKSNKKSYIVYVCLKTFTDAVTSCFDQQVRLKPSVSILFSFPYRYHQHDEEEFPQVLVNDDVNTTLKGWFYFQKGNFHPSKRDTWDELDLFEATFG